MLRDSQDSGCTTEAGSTHSDSTARSALDEQVAESSLSLRDFVGLTRDRCGIAKSKGHWHQRICSIREVCWYIDCEAGISGLDELSVDDSDDCVQAMRELARSFARLAQLPAAPDNRGRGSGSSRKKFALTREAVGDFVGSDVLRALLALG